MARTKQTGKPKKKPAVNGTPKANTAAPPITHKSPQQQPPELSQADTSKVKQWLDKTDKPFSIVTQPASRKRKRGYASMQTQTDLFDPRLDVQYDVKPKDKWECLRRYKKFTVATDSIAVGQCILVKHDDSEEARVDIETQWKAKVLEVRALDTEHVYIRVAWLNRPEDLAKGRKPYHGKNELVPTNQMDVIDAMAVNGTLDVMHWDEYDDDSEMVHEEQFFWRQTFDYANTQTFSELRKICVDDAPQNPDEMIIQCANKDCRKWQHVKCIAEAAVQEAAGKSSGPKKKPKVKDIAITSSSSAVAKAEKNSFLAEVLLKGLPEGDSQIPAKTTEIAITSRDGDRQIREVCCLFCGTEIE